MGKINLGKVIVGGVAAGAVMNVIDYVINGIVLKADFAAVSLARNIPPELGMAGNTIATMVLLDFAMAFLIVLTYAAIRPRFGPGPKTAVIAALLIGLSCNVLAGYFAASGFFGWDLWAKASVLSTANFVFSGLIGSALYQE
jgi:hypothetical protein